MYTVSYSYPGSLRKDRKFDTYAEAKKFFCYMSSRFSKATRVELKVPA